MVVCWTEAKRKRREPHPSLHRRWGCCHDDDDDVDNSGGDDRDDDDAGYRHSKHHISFLSLTFLPFSPLVYYYYYYYYYYYFIQC